ncbi:MULTISPECIES: MATE family efflux transporter [Pacificibacter]|uniref:MATE family efflux transporter n=1 Tax=Pacificibacter TaxID=1042323 RepID=UPI001C095634|nr:MULTISPECIES: MATE family efflux transporter [Pacificibacter]MBU2935901.1 MATE family efflux transporter [Pacificibacter marinus]MDO6614396.1 MATE family efflux transporter [Pacificibacter sp. 1_MG-2023]
MSDQSVASVGALTHKRVLAIAVPIVLSNATVPILGAVDTGVVGQLGEAAPIGAVAIGSVILSSIFWLFGFLRMGTTGLVAQARGAGDAGEVSALLSRVLMIAFSAGLILIVFQIPILWAAFRLAPASAEVETLARDYIAIRIWSAPFAIAIFGFTGWLIASERSRSVLMLQLWMNGLNIVLDLWFVLGLGWGVQGVAIATVIAEITGAIFGLYLCRSALKHPDWKSWAKVFDMARLTNMARVNTDIMIRSILLLSIMVSFAFFGAGFGDLTLAANHILMQFISISAFAMDGFAFTAEVIVGQALGARSRSALRQGAILSSMWGLGISVVITVVFAVFGGAIIDTMTTAPDVQIEARRFLPWMIAVPVAGIGAWMLDGIFIGATRTRDMRNMSALSLIIYLGAVYALTPLFGAHGLWAALLISYLARGLTLAWKYPALEQDAER